MDKIKLLKLQIKKVQAEYDLLSGRYDLTGENLVYRQKVDRKLLDLKIRLRQEEAEQDEH